MEEDARCPICFCEFEGDETPVHQLGCGHKFHVPCILQWAQSDAEMHDSCPVCRFQEHGASRDTELSLYGPVQNATQFAACVKVLRRASTQFNRDEKLLFEHLVKDVERKEEKRKRLLRQRSEFNTLNKKILSKSQRMQREKWRLDFDCRTARRQVLMMFPVTNVVVPVAPRAVQRGPVVVRRSDRLRRSGSSEDESS